MTRIGFPWWANPTVVLFLALGVVWACTTLVGAAQFEAWGMPRYTTAVESAAVGVVLAAAGCALLVIRVVPHPRGSYLPQARRFLASRAATALLYGLAALTLTGYVAWAAIAVLGGVTAQDLLDTVLGRPGAVTALKLKAVPAAGLSTLTQFGPVAALLALARGRLADRPARAVIGLLLGLSALRFVFYAERIALLEIAIPLVILMAALPPRTDRWPGLRRRVIAWFPLLALAAILGLFAVGEYLRTWSSVAQGSFTAYVFDRFLAYYATATNNGVLYARLAAAQGLDQVSFYGLYHLPGAPFGTAAVDGVDFDRWWEAQLESFGNFNLTNVGAVHPMIGELGLPAVAALAFVAVGCTALVYRLARAGHLVALLAVPVLGFAFLELPRISYLTLGRSAPVLASLIAVWFAYDLWRTAPARTEES